ncbi:catechol 2,3-dioxygenase-like lactoylglutathione lyase family enzyme [Thermocatellispora tengchongensis]|uniref:Catechol 2,3-dioxygenase-like lactoylglutathione lyase family enzyme n=1 Tax=Thermocatellispora tengchongensis TaxID=1073253 RepID=A0A840PLP5_9ACTN|nr:VOC family protein [Thermocatellispora tengchongensis]MBB5136965.1 catechol 2,3-dioxygenase-like lactoylglutathione lyase family enzyme [Thermocatellispora tengchongensis]
MSLNVDDLAASINFFTTHLGFHESVAATGFVTLTRPDSADIVLVARGSRMLPGSVREQRPAGVMVYFGISDVVAEYERLRREGVPIAAPLREEPWGERLFQLTDPNGIVIQFVEWVPPAGA